MLRSPNILKVLWAVIGFVPVNVVDVIIAGVAARARKIRGGDQPVDEEPPPLDALWCHNAGPHREVAARRRGVQHYGASGGSSHSAVLTYFIITLKDYAVTFSKLDPAELIQWLRLGSRSPQEPTGDPRWAVQGRTDGGDRNSGCF